MRRRSGALHSDDYDSFLQLCSSSDTRLGLFYDDANEVRKGGQSRHARKSPTKSADAKSVFGDFEFDRVQESLFVPASNEDIPMTTYNAMIVVMGHGEIMQTANPEQTPDLSEEDVELIQIIKTCSNGNVDLQIRNMTDKDGKDVVVKIWINYNPKFKLFDSYYQKVDSFYLVGEDKTYKAELCSHISSVRQNKPYSLCAIQNVQDTAFQQFIQQCRGDLIQAPKSLIEISG